MKESLQREIFQEWLNKYRALLFKVIKAYAFTMEDHNDLFQEICLQIYRSVPSFKAESAVSTWLYRIALNTAIKWNAKEKKYGGRLEKIETISTLLQVVEEATDDRLMWLYTEIKKLNEVDRSLTLLLLDGYSYKEMAQILGISESSIGVKIHRIKKQLANNSKHYNYDGI